MVSCTINRHVKHVKRDNLKIKMCKGLKEVHGEIAKMEYNRKCLQKQSSTTVEVSKSAIRPLTALKIES